MRLTNRTGLPEPLVRAAERVVNGHPKMDDRTFSVTELLKGTKEIVLGRRHSEELEMDVQDTFPLWHGTATHKMLEDEAGGLLLAERRYSLDMGGWDEGLEGFRLSGSPDLYDPKTETLWDYKTTKVAAYQQAVDGRDVDWLYQTLAYAHMLRSVGHPVEHIRIVAMMKDHSKVKADVDRSYPQDPIMVVDFDHAVHDGELDAQMKDALCSRLRDVLSMRELSDGCIPPCTPAERMEDECWVIRQPDAKRAYRKLTSKEQALLALETAPEGMKAYHRNGDPKKCRLYCAKAPFCSFAKSLADRTAEDWSKEDEVV